MKFVLSLACLALLSTTACSGGASEGGSSSTPSTARAGASVDPGEVLVTVGGEVVTKSEFEQAAARKTPANGKTLSEEEKKEVPMTAFVLRPPAGPACSQAPCLYTSGT